MEIMIIFSIYLPDKHTIAYLGGALHHAPPFDITDTRNQLKIQNEDLFLEITLFLEQKVGQT